MTSDLADFLRGFHSAALLAYVQIATETGQFPPDSESVKRRCYELYEAERRARNAGTGQ